MAFVLDAAVGVCITELLQGVIAVTKQTINFKSNLESLENTLKLVKPPLDEIEKLNNSNRPIEEMDQFKKKLRCGMDLVNKCSKIHHLDVFKSYIYSRKLVALEKCIMKFYSTQLLGYVAVNGLKTQIATEKLALRFEHLNINDYSSSTPFSGQLGSLQDLPAAVGTVVGFDEPLKDLKEMLLNDMKTVQVISAPGGCGKTTLATMLCHDSEIQGKFGKNILFVTVSKPAIISVIAGKILKQLRDSQLPEFKNDNHAIKHLESSLKKIAPGPILLVLDDVWPDQEDLICNLTFTLPDYKILVTSRYSFPSFSPVYNLKILNSQHAMILFRQNAFGGKDGSSEISSNLVEKIVKGCKGFPLALKVVGRSLYGRPEVMWRLEQNKWSGGKSVLHTQEELLHRLQTSVDALKEMDSSLWDCFLDLGLFPEDQRIPASNLMDMWAELYDLDDEDIDTVSKLVELAFRNLVNLDCRRKVGIEVGGYCKEYFVMQHDLLRDLSIHQSNTEPIEDRKRLNIEITGNVYPKWWTKEMHQPIHARILSISTDNKFSSSSWPVADSHTGETSWHHLTLPAAEVVILNCCSDLYTIPQFIEGMNQLKVLVITNNGPSFSMLYNFQKLGSLLNLRRIRLERVSASFLATSLFVLVNLQKISFIMCEIGKAFENVTIDLSLVFFNLLEIEIDNCEDLFKLHVGLCKIVSLKKISITYCNELSALPEEIGRLKDLEVLRLNSCTSLIQLPESIGDLHNLKVLDISDCLKISNLPGRMGELCALETIYMKGCQGLSDLHHLPLSAKNLRLLETVICDENTRHLWKPYQSLLKNLEVEEVKEDAYESLLGIISSL